MHVTSFASAFSVTAEVKDGGNYCVRHPPPPTCRYLRHLDLIVPGEPGEGGHVADRLDGRHHLTAAGPGKGEAVSPGTQMGKIRGRSWD